MAKRKIDLFVEINNEKEFELALKHNANLLICAEIYCRFAGSCTALDNLFNTIKLDWSSGMLVLLKIPADEIESLERFRDHSEPVYMFILNHRVTRVFRGVHALKFGEIAKRELNIYFDIEKGLEVDRPTYEIHEATPDEAEWIQKKAEANQLENQISSAKRALRQAARKRHRAERMVPHLTKINFVLFWPHCFHAHPQLYERWDENNIIMVGREEVTLTEESARDVLYSGDAPMNEASMHKLLSGPALAICFRILDDGKDFVALVRHMLYEEIPAYDESKSPEEQRPHMTAFDYYKSYSLTREQILAKRREELIKRREDALHERARRLSEMQRLARQEIEDALKDRAKAKEEKRLELLKVGNLKALKEFDEEPEEEINIEVLENAEKLELPDEYAEEPSDDDEDEYFPPSGLLVPGFYAPHNDVSKTNGLAILFPKIVADYVTPEPEFLPPHVLVMLEVSKRYQAIQAIAPQKKAIIHMGIFYASSPLDGKHIAYSVKQYDTLDVDTDSTNAEKIKLVFMLSVEKDLPLLVLMDLSPSHVSRDVTAGEDECARMFAVDYADEYPEFEDFDVEE